MSDLWRNLRNGAVSAASKVKESVVTASKNLKNTVSSTSKNMKESWDKFQVICPECGCTLTPPASELASETPVFKCGNCQTLLKTPSRKAKALFLAELSVDKVGQGIGHSLGSKQFVSVEVTVPDGVRGNELFQVNYEGVDYTVRAPPGKNPGDTFNLNIDITLKMKKTRVYVAKRGSLEDIPSKEKSDTNEIETPGTDDAKPAKDETEAEKIAKEIYENQI